MRWMIWGRQWGKSYQTVQWLKEDPDNRVIVTADESMADGLRRRYSLREDQVFGAGRWIHQHRHLLRKTIAIDNAEQTLPALLNVRVGLVNASGVNEQPVGLRVDEDQAKHEARAAALLNRP
jgi:hypothetical protein